jgi:AraC-like DNA-binding protein
LNGREFALSPGTLFTYSPRIDHRIATDAAEPLAKYFVDLSLVAPRRLMRRLKLEEGHAWQTSRPAEILRLFEEMIQHGMSGLPLAREICDRLCETIFLHASQSALPLGGGEMISLGTYQRCCHVIDTQGLQLRSMAQVAQACRLDPAYICRLFQRYERRSPYQRLVQVRMNHAAAKLRTGNVLIKQVAAELGYDPFHFSRLFKRVFGCSPEAMRTMR